MGWSAFQPHGPSLTIAVTTTASAGQQALASSGNPAVVNYRISNASSQPVFLTGSGNPNAIAVVGVAGTQTPGQFIGANATEVFTYAQGVYFSAVCATGTSTVYVTPGDGL